MTYFIQDYAITETYQKKEKQYFFHIEKDEKSYDTLVFGSFPKKKLIQNIQNYSKDEVSCIQLSSKQIHFSILCRNHEEQISYHLVKDLFQEEIQEKIPLVEEQNDHYEQVDIFNLLDYQYYIWNYRGFYRIQNQKKETISLFEQDIYEPKLLTDVNGVLFIPDYSQEYFFDKVYLLDMKKGSISTWNLEHAIYFDSVVLGSFQNDFYVVDKHEQKEWKLNVKQKTMKEEEGITYQNGWKKVRITQLMNQNYTFSGLYPKSYEIDDGLYEVFADDKIKIDLESPTKVIYQNQDVVFFLKEDTLYAFLEPFGKVKIMKSFEWNFNHQNILFINNE